LAIYQKTGIVLAVLNKREKYLQIAFNRSLPEVQAMISLLPRSDKIIIEAGTPFIKQYGTYGVSLLKNWWGYVVADLKCMDRGSREVTAMAAAGASAATCLGLAPIETINEFIRECETVGIDSMVDMMNVEFPFEILQKLKKLPTVVVLHRGVDENELNKGRQIPHEQIHRIKGTYGNVLISVAGGESTRDVVRTYFNDADIAVIWRSFYDAPNQTAQLAQDFVKLVR
jgi:bifunctional enzyme Fae/Hps